VVPYDRSKPEPYLIMEMPVHFSDHLCDQVERFYAASACEHVNCSTATFDNPILRARYQTRPKPVRDEGNFCQQGKCTKSAQEYLP